MEINREYLYAWVYWKRPHENYAQIYLRELEKTAEMKGIDLSMLSGYFERVGIEEIMGLRKRVSVSCTKHGSFVSMSSKMSALLDAILEDQKNPQPSAISKP